MSNLAESTDSEKPVGDVVSGLTKLKHHSSRLPAVIDVLVRFTLSKPVVAHDLSLYERELDTVLQNPRCYGTPAWDACNAARYALLFVAGTQEALTNFNVALKDAESWINPRPGYLSPW